MFEPDDDVEVLSEFVVGGAVVVPVPVPVPVPLLDSDPEEWQVSRPETVSSGL